MIIEITSREFRADQKKYFELADNGTKIILKRGKKQAYVLTPIDDGDLELTPKMIEKINHSLAQAKAGNVKELRNEEDINKLLGIS